MDQNANVKFEIPEVANIALKPLANSIGETLSNIWKVVFGAFDLYAEKKALTRQYALSEFKESLESKVAAIPEDKLQEPRISLIGPALEASKYYFEEPVLREMFANLIAASLNSSLNSKVRSSFTTIIKDLEPIDASHLQLFKSRKTTQLPFVDLLFRKDNSAVFSRVEKLLFFENDAFGNLLDNAASLTNLERLGLIKILKGTYLTNDELYEKYYDYPKYKYFSSEQGLSSIKLNGYDKVELEKGIIELTQFGSDFNDVCL